ncbi:Formate/nitrite transporter-domain-containing protein [Xylogone sp. PMI_703]|nr:Formate/nitrite transporter-domain-containing protein [Xylogone sp. PMI_703]
MSSHALSKAYHVFQVNIRSSFNILVKVQFHFTMLSIHAASPDEITQRVNHAAVSKATLGWSALAVRAFLGGSLIALGALVNLSVLGCAVGLRDSNPSIATLIASFTFPTGFFLITITNAELVTASFFIMLFARLQGKISTCHLVRNWVVGYICNMAGALFFAGFMAWWTNSLGTDAEKSFAATQAEARVNIASYWSVNFLRGVGCNWLVGLAIYGSIAADDNLTKTYSIWIPVWAFAGLGYQHSIANYFLIPIGMFYGAGFSVGEFIYKSIIPVTLGNAVGGGFLTAASLWFLFGEKKERLLGSNELAKQIKPSNNLQPSTVTDSEEASHSLGPAEQQLTPVDMV